jgi:hypothetical protein
MSLLNKVTTGIQSAPQMSLVFGPPGVGKSTFASKIPSVLLADIEDSTKSLDAVRLGSKDLPDYASVVALINELATTNHTYKALAVDSITTLEAYINKAVCEEHSVKELSDLSFGKGVSLAKEKLREFLSLCKKLQNEKGMDIWFIGHTLVKKFADPMLMSSFDRYTLQAADGFGSEVIRQSDNVYFVKYNVELALDKNTKKAKGISDGERMLLTRHNAAYDAKTRLNLPEAIPFSYEAYEAAVASYGPKTSSDLVSDIESLLLKTQAIDLELYKMAKEKLAAAAGDNSKLQRIKEKLLDATKAS